MLPLQQYCKAAVPNFFSGQTTDLSSVSERVTHLSISSSWLFFLHPRLTCHILCTHDNVTMYLSRRCRMVFWGLLPHCPPGDRQSPERNPSGADWMDSCSAQVTLSTSAESLQPPAQGHWRAFCWSVGWEDQRDTNHESLVQLEPEQSQIQPATAAKMHLEDLDPPLMGRTLH